MQHSQRAENAKSSYLVMLQLVQPGAILWRQPLLLRTLPDQLEVAQAGQRLAALQRQCDGRMLG